MTFPHPAFVLKPQGPYPEADEWHRDFWRWFWIVRARGLAQ